MKNLFTGLCLCAALAFTACQSTDDGSSMAMMNTNCPISGEMVDEGSPTREYDGMKVAFCCNNCAGKWDAMSDAEKAAKAAEMKQ